MKPPSEVLKLGHRIARELGNEAERDTLRSWMAHHLADLLIEAETSEEARDKAVETILRIWAHRGDLPGRAYPLADYRGVLSVFDRLKPEADPWSRVSKHEKGYELGCVFESFSRLVLAGIFTTIPDRLVADDEDAAENAMSPAELEVWRKVREWREYFDRRTPDPPRVVVVFNEPQESSPASPEGSVMAADEQPEEPFATRLRANVRAIIANARQSLDDFERNLDSYVPDERDRDPGA